MANPPVRQPEPNVLTDAMATEVLARASELDQQRASGTAVSDLRTAATEAGITADSFDAALAELQARSYGSGQQLRGRARRRMGVIIASTAAVLLASLVTLAAIRRRSVSDVQAAPSRLIDEAIVLQCLTPDEAAELIRPVPNLRQVRVVIRPAQAPRLIALTATAVQLQQVKALLAPYEAPGSPTCATPPTR